MHFVVQLGYLVERSVALLDGCVQLFFQVLRLAARAVGQPRLHRSQLVFGELQLTLELFLAAVGGQKLLRVVLFDLDQMLSQAVELRGQFLLVKLQLGHFRPQQLHFDAGRRGTRRALLGIGRAAGVALGRRP